MELRKDWGGINETLSVFMGISAHYIERPTQHRWGNRKKRAGIQGTVGEVGEIICKFFASLKGSICDNMIVRKAARLKLQVPTWKTSREGGF